MRQPPIQITNEVLQTIYSNLSMLNAVASAHQCLDKHSNFKHHLANCYPIAYIVTDEQIKLAKDERERVSANYMESHQLNNTLVFRGMGCDYAPRYEDDICNHRVRAEFLNVIGHKFFIEVGTGVLSGSTCITHCIDRDLEESSHWADNRQPWNNYKGIERLDNPFVYKLSNLLAFVNEKFNCAFERITIDQHYLLNDQFVSTSPK